MKNLFLVFNKEKIYAYIVSIMTIVAIFFMSSLMNSDLKNTEVTSANDVNNNTIGEAIYTSSPYNTSEEINNDSIETKNENLSTDK